jgi:Helix-turn-helix domain
MSFRHINWVFTNASRYKWGCGLQLVLLSLADQMNQDGECWPSHQHTANRVGLTEKQVRRHVTKLKSLGLITVIKNEKGGRPGDTPRYRALFNASNDAKGNRAPTYGSPTTPTNVALEAPIRPMRLPSMPEYPSHQREPNHQRTINESSINREVTSIENDMPKELTSWADILLAGRRLGLMIRDPQVDIIESQAAFAARVQAAHKAFWMAKEINSHGKSA